MKCLILAGGSGDRLWPLSRKNYPKQFMEINNNRSLLQETVVRNLPFCDEFLISTNSAYHFIVRAQMKAFQGLTYRCFLEEIPGGTAAAVALICMLSNPSELILVVSADTITGHEHYQDAILEAKELAKQGNIVVFGAEIDKIPNSGGYIEYSGNVIKRFYAARDKLSVAQLSKNLNLLIHTGMSLSSAGTMIRAIKEAYPALYSECIKLAKKVKKGMDIITLPAELVNNIEVMSLEKAVFERKANSLSNLKLVRGKFYWKNVDCYEDLKYPDNPVIEHACENTLILNATDKHLLVADSLENVTIVHTKDVTFVGKSDDYHSVKQLIADYSERYPTYFNDHDILYFTYGTQEILVNQKGYKVKKTVIYPGYELKKHRHANRCESWTITEGKAIVSIGEKRHLCVAGDTIAIEENAFHKIENNGNIPVTIIRTIMGVLDSEVETSAESASLAGSKIEAPNIVKLSPIFKDYIWGGTQIKSKLNKKTDLDRVAESWELSAHEDGQSVIAEGPYKGLRFGKYLNLIGKEAWGWKAASLPRFPLLIKFLDSAQALSLQVHPDDEYALGHENEYGKYEMWYILEAKENAKIYQGFRKNVSDDEIKECIEKGTLMEILNERPVKAGDTIFIEPGCVHALGEGILLCEIQQNSNITYRLYDYDRFDAYMNKRPLHIEKALEVIKHSSYEMSGVENADVKKYENYSVTTLGSCKYFVSQLYDILEEAIIEVDESSFYSILIIDGEARISDAEQEIIAKKGDSLFLKAGKYSVSVSGTVKLILTHV